MEKIPAAPHNKIESSHERILSREKILEALEQFAEGAIPVRELSDEKGIYLLEVQQPGEKPGEITEHCYIRKGGPQNGTRSEETKINVAYYQDGMPVGGSSVAALNEETGEWV